MLYRNLILRLLLFLPPETAQNLAETILRFNSPWILFGNYINSDNPQLNTEISGISISSPIGLAAGFDKDFRMLRALSELDFGYITAGTVVLDPQPGHPKPRLLRDVDQKAILNCMGFPSKGIKYAIESLKSLNDSKVSPVFGSISGTDITSMQKSCAQLSPFVSGLEVNISSPNTSGLKTFHDSGKLSEMINAIRDLTEKPLIIKLPPHIDELHEIEDSFKLARICIDSGADGITLANSHPTIDPRLSVGQGGLSGAPLLKSTLQMVSYFRSHLGDIPIINACGGIFTGDDVFSAVRAGANTAQLYTALVYRGPLAIRQIKRELLIRMRREGIGNVADIYSVDSNSS